MHAIPIDPSSLDVTLLRGLEPVLTLQEQATLTAMLVSGDPVHLAQASKCFSILGDLLTQGITPGERSPAHQQSINESFHYVGSLTPNELQRNPLGYNNYEARVAEEMKLNEQDQKQRSYALPLPVRMPRWVQMPAFDTNDKNPSLQLLDFDIERMTLGLAFTKLQVKNNGSKLVQTLFHLKHNSTDDSGVHIETSFTPSKGYDAIVANAPQHYDTILGEETKKYHMILIAHTHHELTKLGLHCGDVITHVNGRDVSAMNISEVKDLLQECYENRPSEPLEIVVNAELCVAQALKYRALA